MGLLWTAKAKLAGTDCRLILRPNKNTSNTTLQYKQIDKPGIDRFKVDCCPSDQLAQKSVKRLVVATKAYDIEAAIKPLLPALNEGAIVICLSNGMRIQQNIQRLLQHENKDLMLFWAASSDGALATGDAERGFELVQTGYGNTIVGTIDNRHGSGGYSTSHQLDELKHWDLDISFNDPVTPFLWKKFFINCAINPLTAYFACKNGELLSNKDYKEHFDAIISELEDIACRLDWQTLSQHYGKSSENTGAGIPPDTDIRRLSYSVAQKTAENQSSMRMDFEHQRPNELDFLNGHFLELANLFKVEAPFNTRLVNALKARSEGQ